MGCALPAAALFPAWQKHNPPPPAGAHGAQVAGASGLVGQAPSTSHAAIPPPSGWVPHLRLSGPGPHNGDWLRQYLTLPPSQQEQRLQQDPAYQKLTPDKQQRLLQRLRSFNSQPPEKKQQILNRMEKYEHLTPSQQAAADNLFQRYHSLPDDRRTQVLQGYRKMQLMTPEQRTQYMSSEEYRNTYSEDERDLLRGMADLNSGPTH